MLSLVHSVFFKRTTICFKYKCLITFWYNYIPFQASLCFNVRKQLLEVFYKNTWPETCNFIEKENLAQVIPCEFCEVFKNIFITEQLRMTASESRHATDQNLINISL